MTRLLLRLFVRNADQTGDPKVRSAYGVLSGAVGILCNFLLFAGKLVVGTISGSVSVTADAVNNLSDASSSIVTLVGFRIAEKPADEGHPYGHARVEYLSGLVVAALILIIGVELIRMLYLHTPITVFEVLLFAIARQIIIDHSSPLNSLLGVVAIAILFATRKFLFSAFDETDKTIFRATQKIHQINRLFRMDIPSNDKDDTLLDVLLDKMHEDGMEIGTGACVYFSDLGLRIAKMKDGKITRIEVIRSIH